ncbi:MAG: DUF1829 domain-containing protein [Thermoguttaceae bacterium]
MTAELKNLIDDYNKWLHDKTVLKNVGDDWFEITTPYLDRHNDALQIYVRKNDGGYLLTDDDYVISDLAISGCVLDSPKRQSLLNITLAGFGVQRQKDSLIVQATPENFPHKKHSLIQAMLAVNDLFYLADPHIKSLFYEDVIAWLDAVEVRYTTNCKLPGRSGYDHSFNFIIPKSKNAPERILQAINHPDRRSAESLVFKWEDTKRNRSPNAECIAMLNDADGSISGNVIDAFRNYNIGMTLWSERKNIIPKLGA